MIQVVVAESDIIRAKWIVAVEKAVLEAAKAEVGLSRIQFSAQRYFRSGTETLDRIQIVLTVKAP